jgi:hypothetical protein
VMRRYGEPAGCCCCCAWAARSVLLVPPRLVQLHPEVAQGCSKAFARLLVSWPPARRLLASTTAPSTLTSHGERNLCISL